MAFKSKAHINPLGDSAYTLRALICAAPLPVVTFDAVSLITLVNPVAERLFGKKSARIHGKSFPDLFSQLDIRKKLSNIRSLKNILELETQITDSTGKDLELTLWIMPLESTPRKKNGYLAVFLDRTENHFMERALLEASEREKKNIGQNLHDELCQQLVGAAFAAKAVSDEFNRKGTSGAERLGDLARLINGAVTETRDIVRGLRPVDRDAAGLMSALDELVHSTNPKIPMEFICNGSVFVSNPDSALQAYRIVQESLFQLMQTGMVKKMSLSLLKKKKTVIMKIIAEGIGKKSFLSHINPLDLKILEYRAKAITGTFSIVAESTSKLDITCSFPEPL
ncbi:MAG: histidine kinase [Chthoniobacterales bacterium]